MKAGIVRVPRARHECPRPDQDILRESTDPTFPASHYYELVSPSVPPGSTWRCPECGAKWIVVDRGEPFVGSFGWAWMKRTSGFWWRALHKASEERS